MPGSGSLLENVQGLLKIKDVKRILIVDKSKWFDHKHILREMTMYEYIINIQLV